MSRPQRNKTRLDYARFNETGERVFIDVKDELRDDTQDEQSSEYDTPGNVSFESVSRDGNLSDHSVDDNNPTPTDSVEFEADHIALLPTTIVEHSVARADQLEEPANHQVAEHSEEILLGVDDLALNFTQLSIVEDLPLNTEPPVQLVEDLQLNIEPPVQVVEGLPLNTDPPDQVVEDHLLNTDPPDQVGEDHPLDIAEEQEETVINMADQLLIDEATVSDDIDDFLEENEIKELGSNVQDFDLVNRRAEELRTQYRSVHNKLKAAMGEEPYKERFNESSGEKLKAIKSYIKNLKQARKGIREKEDMKHTDTKDNKFEFLKKEFKLKAEELKTIFIEEDDQWEAVEDEQLEKRKASLEGRLKILPSLANLIKDIMEVSTNKASIDVITKEYEGLLTSKSKYVERLDKEVKDRQIEERKAFNKAKLSIKLPKFKGYKGIDFYSFKSDFEKLNLKTTPKELLPDLLKNNYLENPALLLVKDVRDIDDIWKRLKSAYGDCKILLSNKVAEIGEIDGLWKHKEPEKVINGVSKILNLMRDLMHLAEEHSIEDKLYHGDALEKIHELMGEGRFTRWLSVMCEKELSSEKAKWDELILFLEKELKIYQQKLIYTSKSKKKPQPPSQERNSDRKDKKNQDSANPVYTNQGQSNLCQICGATDHVQTSGPNGTKLTQYFVCKKFVEMTNAQRLEELRSKNLCIQCLFPGADGRTGKHKDGKCQRDFICKHPSHDRFDCKKHVLVCDDHKTEDQNKATFEEYKRRCINRRNQVDLPEYAKGIVIHYTRHSSEEGSQSDEESTSKAEAPGAKNKEVQFVETVEDSALQDIKFENSSEQVVEVGETPQLKSILKSEPKESTPKESSHSLTLDPNAASFENNTGQKPPEPEGVDEYDEEAVYMLQRTKVEDEVYNLFYDGGCKAFVPRYSAVQRIGSRATQIQKGPVTIWGVGGMTMETPHGKYKVELPRRDGGVAVLSGVCMDVITEPFPKYPLAGQVENDITAAYVRDGGNANHLPKLEPVVGGETDFMIGIKFNRHFPTEIYKCPVSGLAIYESVFENASGGYGIIGGSHAVFTQIERFHNLQSQHWNFLTAQQMIYSFRSQVNPDLRMLGYRDTYEDTLNYHVNGVDQDLVYRTSIQARLKKYEESQLAGSEIKYRCPKCRLCEDCKCPEKTTSIKEEMEQHIIEKSVTVNVEEGYVMAELPLISDPVVKLAPNMNIARKVYDQQTNKLSKNDEERESVIKSEAKLEEQGYVGYVKDLPFKQQKQLEESPNQNLLVWRYVHKPESLTTPYRLVFDASMPTASGYSLNDIVAKGTNNLNKLVEIYACWRTHQFAYHNDVNKMYNTVKLCPKHWCLQRYLWEPTLDPTKEPLQKIIMTIIYGVKSSGNQAECALRKVADLFKDDYPEVYDVIMKDFYVDDCLSGEPTEQEAYQRMDELELVLNHAGMTLKSFTVSGKDPDPALSADGESILVAGHKYFPKPDLSAFNIKELNFAKKKRGRTEEIISAVPANLTRTMCASKVAEVFDLLGLATPITATWNVDLHCLVNRQLKWDDTIPDNLRPLWGSNFDLMGELKTLRYHRAVVPADAVDLNMETLEFGDASKAVVCVAIYVRFLRTCGNYSCQLLLAKSRLVPEGTTQPRGELFAAVVNSHAGQIVKNALGKYHQKATKFTDSQIVLFWLSNNERALKQWVRNRVIEVLRWTAIPQWFYVRSNQMIADIGTRPCRSVQDIDQNSVWINGYEWMLLEDSEFPTLTAEDIRLSNTETVEAKTEIIIVPEFVHIFEDARLCPTESAKARMEIAMYAHQCSHINTDALLQRYQFSNYLIDPNRHRFQRVIRILAMAVKYIRIIQDRIRRQKNGETVKSLRKATNVVTEFFIPEEDIKSAEAYFHRKASDEVRHFLSPGQYTKISTEVNGILHYTGRILPDDEVSIVGRATEVMKDLCTTTFCVPLTDKYSPIAFSLINDIHWHDKSVLHSGVETTWRYVLKQMYVLEGRSLVQLIKDDCQRCRYLAKKALAVQMGPISNSNITIAPAFYMCQLDIAGPFSCYSPHQKRTTIKIWLIVFCCTTTSATNIKVMESYGVTSFLQAFTRFACQVGYPKRVLTDEGSQLIKGCSTMKINFTDLQYQLHRDCKVELEVCPVGGHNMHGKVERRIRHVRESIGKSVSHERLGMLQWETISASIANSINNLPLALGNKKGDFEVSDLITPNRLLLGRNNDRSPDSPLTVIDDYDTIITENNRIFQSWFECWLISHVPKLITQPKWFNSDRDMKEGDVVLFLKQEKELCSTYQYGVIQSTEVGRDGKIRKVNVRYRNHNENTDRFTFRSTRSLVMIHPVDEITVMQELGQIAAKVDAESRIDHSRQPDKSQ